VTALVAGSPASSQQSATDVTVVRLLLVGVPERQAQALLASLEGLRVHVDTLAVAACDAGTLQRLAPHAMLVPIWHLSAMAEGATTAAIPIVALNLRAQAIDWTMPALRGAAAISTTDIVSDPRATVTLALRAAASSRLNGALAVILPGPTRIVEAAQELAAHAGLRAIACTTPAGLTELLTDAQPVLVLACETTPARAIRAVADIRAADASSLVLVSIGDVPLDAAVAWDARLSVCATDGDREALDDALDRLRRLRITRGRHAATNLRMPRAMQADAGEAWTELSKLGPSLTAIVIRPEEVAEPAHWASEARRLATCARLAFGSTSVGYDDDDSLVILAPTPAADAEREVQGWARLPALISWSAGIADTGETRAQDYQYLRSCAREALAADAPTTVRRWKREIAAAVPDVVIVEPDAILSDMLQYGLRGLGFSCRALNTGSDALAALRRLPPTARPTLVVTDVDLAGIDGHSLHERLQIERPGAFAFVFLSNHAAEGEQLRALEAGARDYLIKPISVRVLLARLKRLLRDN